MSDGPQGRLDAFTYELPDELIAQVPARERSEARLLHLDRGRGIVGHGRVRDLPALLDAGDLVVVNDAKVIPARVHGRRPSGGRLELLFLQEVAAGEWRALVRGAPRVGERVTLPEADGEWTAEEGGGRWRVRVATPDGVPAWLDRVGAVPLPPYVRRPDGPTADDAVRYQTVFARVPGAVAAPTAGLHFTPALLAALDARGVRRVALTLHVGPGTFLPMRDGVLDGHVMEGERYELPAATVEAIAETRARGGRVVAVGTTTTRTLESVAADGGLRAGAGVATLFIRPGHRFRVVDAILTNFHLPGTPLLALVGAFAGCDAARAAYEVAVLERYRFYSYGDAMLLT